MLSELVLHGLPHRFSVLLQGADLLPGEPEFRTQHGVGVPGMWERRDGGLLLLCGFDTLADAVGVGEPGGDASGAGDRTRRG